MKQNMRKVMMIVGVAGAMFFGSTLAYLTDYDEAVNEFTVGKVEIELTEPNWKPEENTQITPTQEIKKDPKITNTGVNDAYVYLQVAIPKAEVITADAQGNRQALASTELFTFTKKDGWELISKDDGQEQAVYTYAYNQILKADAVTGTLFDSVTFANIIEGQLDTAHLTVPVRAYAIQTTNTGEGADVVAQAKDAFQKYVNQNKNQDGKVL